METWDLLDENGNKTGQVIEKTPRLPVGYYHLGVDIWIENDDGKYLFQKRSATKKRAPGKWMQTCGSVLSGESGMDAVLREVSEELGIHVNKSDAKLLFKTKFQDCINEVWLLHHTVDMNALILQTDEVGEARWASEDEIIDMVNNETIVGFTMEYLNMVFEEKHRDIMLIE